MAERGRRIGRRDSRDEQEETAHGAHYAAGVGLFDDEERPCSEEDHAALHGAADAHEDQRSQARRLLSLHLRGGTAEQRATPMVDLGLHAGDVGHAPRPQMLESAGPRITIPLEFFDSKELSEVQQIAAWWQAGLVYNSAKLAII